MFLVSVLPTIFVFSRRAAGRIDLAVTAAPRDPGERLLNRAEGQTDCDGGHNLFICDQGTCYWGSDGFVGCCSTTSCVPRTRCIEYADLGKGDNRDCDHNYGGCVVCSKDTEPYCVTNSNLEMSEYAYYCAATGFLYTTGFSHNARPTPTTRNKVLSTESKPTSTNENTDSDHGSGHDKETGDSGTTAPGPALSSTGSDGTSEEDDDVLDINKKAPSISNSTKTGIIIGVVCGVVGILLGAWLAWYCKRRRRSTARSEHPVVVGPLMNQPTHYPSEFTRGAAQGGGWADRPRAEELPSPVPDQQPQHAQYQQAEYHQAQHDQPHYQQAQYQHSQ